MKIVPLTGSLGAEIFDADLKDPAQFAEIETAFTRFSVIALRAQDITPDDLLSFARRFGPINVNRFFHPARGPSRDRDRPQGTRSAWGHRRRLAHRSRLRSSPCHGIDPACD